MFSIIACEQAGKIVTDAEATLTAMPTATVVSLEIEASKFKLGDEVVIIGGLSGALVPLYGSAGAKFFSSQVLHGTKVAVLGLLEIDGVIWYQIEGLIGAGWLLDDHLLLLSDYEALEAESE